jgi:parvulin-like peptidyl-prolyl isomerase
MIELRGFRCRPLFACLVVGLGMPILGHGEKLVEINRIVAQVEKNVITQGELNRVLELLSLGEQEKAQRTQEFIENKIENMLVIQEFRDEGRVIPESYLEGEYNKRLIRDFDNDRKLFRDFLNSKSQTQLDFRRDLENDIIIGAMYAKFRRGRADVSPDRVEDFYKNNLHLFAVEPKIRLSEIKLEPVGGETRDALLKQANALVKQLKVGASFSELAKKHSHGRYKESGGDWGVFVSKREIPNELLREKSFALKKGEFSEPFALDETRRDKAGEIEKTGRFAIFIMKAEDTKAAGIKSIDEVRQEVEQRVGQNLDRQAKARWVARLRRNAYVKYFATPEN